MSFVQNNIDCGSLEYILTPETFLHNDHHEDKTDGSTESDESSLTEQKIEKLRRKMERTKEELIHLQTVKREDVVRYLKTADDTSEVSNAKTKLHFERNIRKSNSCGLLLQKKLQKYRHQVRELEQHGFHEDRTIIKAVQESVRSSALSITDAVTKPLETFGDFIRKEIENSTLGDLSAIKQPITYAEGDDSIGELCHSTPLPTPSTTGRATGDLLSLICNPIKAIAVESDDSLNATTEECSSDFRNTTLEDSSGKSMVESIETEDEEYSMLLSRIESLEKTSKEIKQNTTYYDEKLSKVLQSIHEVRYNTEQVHCRLNDLCNQWSDLTELHQNEMQGMKEAMEETVERIEFVQYRFSERTTETEDHFEKCQNRLLKIESGYEKKEESLESYFNVDAKILLTRYLSFFLINFCVVIAFLISPFVKTLRSILISRSRIFASLAMATAFVFFWKNS